jgi:tRNA 2-selenouridine synthase SelU
MQIKLPAGFINDHQERFENKLNIIKKNKKHIYLDSEDPAIPNLLSDAEFYFSMLGKKHFVKESEKFCIMARTLLDSYKKQMQKVTATTDNLQGEDIPTDQTNEVQDDPSLGSIGRDMDDDRFVEDADALTSAGMGTDEDYDYYGRGEE